MTSIFDPNVQRTDVDSKIAAALERLSQAYRVLLWEQNKKHNLSPIQIQLLVFLRYHSKTPPSVGQLAKEFSLTPATISDAINYLVEKGHVVRQKSKTDRRVISILPTNHGKKIALQLSTWADAIRQCISDLGSDDKQVAMKFLMQLIASLQRDGIITVTRMCVTCKYFKVMAQTKPQLPYFCTLLQKPLAEAELRFDCLEHEAMLKS